MITHNYPKAKKLKASDEATQRKFMELYANEKEEEKREDKNMEPDNAVINDRGVCRKCGKGEGIIYMDREENYYVHCSECNAVTGTYVFEIHAKAAWRNGDTLNRKERRKRGL